MNEAPQNDIIGSARYLLASSFRGVLATHSGERQGYPFGSLLPYSRGRDGWPLLLLSHLAQHTKNLLADPHCNLTLVEQGVGDVQKLTRVSCMADAILLETPDAALCRRHFRYFPESAPYYHELNFRFFRLQPVRFHCIAGFGAARWIGVDRMRSETPFTTAQEEDLLATINQRFAGRLPRPLLKDDPGASPLAVGLDAAGVDLRCATQCYRLALAEPTDDPGEFVALLEGNLSGTL
jgi:hypothetical protein